MSDNNSLDSDKLKNFKDRIFPGSMSYLFMRIIQKDADAICDTLKDTAEDAVLDALRNQIAEMSERARPHSEEAAALIDKKVDSMDFIDELAREMAEEEKQRIREEQSCSAEAYEDENMHEEEQETKEKE